LHGTATPDRCFFIDEDGEFISGDFITALLSQAFLLKDPGATVVYDLRASYAVKDIVAAHGGTAVMNRVGHAFFKARMRELNAVFGGEVTGHYYFRDNFYCDNGFIPALLILELMSKTRPVPQAAARAAAQEVLHLRRDQHEDAEHGGDAGAHGRHRGPLSRTPRYSSSTVFRWSIRTGTSTCGRRTPSRCCGSTSRDDRRADAGQARRTAVDHPRLTRSFLYSEPVLWRWRGWRSAARAIFRRSPPLPKRRSGSCICGTSHSRSHRPQ
jgi:hypothetical protein